LYEQVSSSGKLVGRVRLRFTPDTTRGPGGHNERRDKMKSGIHPEYITTEVTCGCGNTFSTRSTKSSGSIHVEVCSNCHPFYTGKQKILDTGGRVARFEARYGKRKK
jgi:large subunit ribosomal protein L31